MADKQLVSFIRNALLRGADANSVQIDLLRKGYGQQQIEAALREAEHIEVRHVLQFSPAVIGLLIALLTAAAGFGYFIFSNGAPSKATALLDINLEPIKASAVPGEELIVLKELTNMGSAKGYDVELRTELINPRTGAVLSSKTETRAIETIGSTQTRIGIPLTVQPGEYIIRTIAEYSGKRAVASLRAAVTPKQDAPSGNTESNLSVGGEGQNETEEVQTIVQQECDDFNTCTSDSFREGACSFTPITPCCGNGQCEQGELCAADCPAQLVTQETPGIRKSQTLDSIKLMATSNPEKAMQECAKQEIPDYRDSCFSNVAKVAKNTQHCLPVVNERIKDVCFAEVAKVSLDSSACGSIAREDRRDSCYLTFVLDYKDYSVCGSIINENLRQSCNALRELEQNAAPSSP